MPTETAQAVSRRRRTRDPDRLAIAAMSFASLVLRLRDYNARARPEFARVAEKPSAALATRSSG